MAMIADNRALLESGDSISAMEKQIFSLMKTASESCDPPVVCRVAGGWVRDKLLGLGSDDLDFALENISGCAFGEHLKSFADVKLHLNPEKSQHLDSAKVYVFNTAVDMCQLRWDEYSTSSRIPTVRVGTPQEDALRRDFTMNCLYYNVNTGKVEDWTTGIQDLQSGVVRTPRDALVSFNEDPLRIFRAVRFATRFGFTIDESLLKAAAAVKTVIAEKVTRPRMEQEISRTLNGKDPLRAIEYFEEMGLFELVFDSSGMWGLDFSQVRARVEKVCARATENKYALVLAGVYAPLCERQPVPDPAQPRKKISCLECAIVRQMRAESDVLKIASKVLRSAGIVKELLKNGDLSRVSVGRWLREVDVCWRLTGCVLFDEELEQFFDSVLVPFVEEQRLEGVWDMKPLMNGRDLAALHKVKPGPMVSELVNKLIEWQLMNPDGTLEQYKQTLARCELG